MVVTNNESCYESTNEVILLNSLIRKVARGFSGLKAGSASGGSRGEEVMEY